MATEILINDGGAPARILPYEAAEAITAGSACTVDANGKLQLAASWATIPNDSNRLGAKSKSEAEYKDNKECKSSSIFSLFKWIL